MLQVQVLIVYKRGKDWKVNWSEKRKNITFENENGDKVRDSNVSKTFNMNINKEALIYEFDEQSRIRAERARAEQEERDRNEELEQYISELNDYIEAEGSNREPEAKDIRTSVGSEELSREREEQGESTEEDIRAFIDELNTKERTSAKERADREAEQCRLDTERQREAERRERYLNTD